MVSPPININGYKIKTARNIAEVEELRTIWEKLQWHPDGDIDRYLMLMTSRKEFLRPHILCLFKDGSPTALVVGRIENLKLNMKFGYLSLFRPTARSFTVGYGGFLGEISEIESKLIMSELSSLLASGENDVIFLQALRIGSNIWSVAKERQQTMFRDDDPPISHWRLVFPTTYQEYLDGLSKQTRARLRKEANRIQKKFGDTLSVQCYKKINDLDTIIRDQETIAQKTYHRGLGVGFISDDKTRKRLTAGLERGFYRSYIIYIDKKPASFLDGTSYHKTFFGGTTGYDPEYEYYHFGTFILVKIIENLIEEGFEAMDFGLGDSEYKRIYCNESWQETDFYIFAPTIKGKIISGIRSFIMNTDQWSRKLLRKYDLEGKMKKMWRNKLAKQEKDS
jgi:hypothetical protein